MIDIKQLSFGYKKHSKLFDQLDLNIETGKIHGLLGKNGAGKTTLLKLIAGLQYPQDGEISINSILSKGRAPQYLNQYFFVAEEFNLPSIKVNCYLDIYAPFYKDFDRDAFNSYLVEFNIPSNQKLNKMSYGQKKKFLLSFGLATNSKILFMDEPTNGLDIPSKSTFRKLIAANITDERAFIISTHQIKDIEDMIDAVIILESGKVMFKQSMLNIGENLSFKTVGNEDSIKDTIYTQDFVMNKKVIAKNSGSEDTPIDVELLFNAVISDAPSITNEFKQN